MDRFSLLNTRSVSLSTNFTLATTVSVTTKLTVVWSPMDISVTVCWSNQTWLGLLLFSVSSLSPNDDLPFGEMNPLLCIDALLLIVPTLVAFVREELLTLLGLNLCCFSTAGPFTLFELNMVTPFSTLCTYSYFLNDPSFSKNQTWLLSLVFTTYLYLSPTYFNLHQKYMLQRT